MPNWCSNSVVFSHNDSAMIDRIEKAFTGRWGSSDKGLFSEFLPCPAELYETSAPNQTNPETMMAQFGASDWYNWCVNNWGTKWDVKDDSENPTYTRPNPNTIKMSFDTAWSPAIPFYEHLESLGFNVRAMYYEPGMCFCGVYEDGMDDDYDLSSMDSDDVAQTIPQELDEEFCISENMADWEAEQEEGV